MELIKKLPSRKDKNDKWQSYAIFWCDYCNREVEKTRSNGLKAKSCGCKRVELMSKSLTGYKHTKETRQRMREKGKLRKPPMRGKKQSEEAKQKRRETSIGENNPFYGKKHTKETRQLMKEKHANFNGKNNPNWQNGISFEPYSPEFNKEIKQIILKRDNYTCQNPNCEHLSKKLDIHHIDYDKQNNNTENLITLCAKCHTKTNFNRDFYAEFCQTLLINRFMECLL